MSTADGSVRAPNARGADHPEHLRQQKPEQRPSTVYFPMGYKEAAYQWVSAYFNSSDLDHTANNPTLVDKCNASHG